MSFYKNSGVAIKQHVYEDANSPKEEIAIGELRSVPALGIVYKCVPYESERGGCSSCVFSLFHSHFKSCKICCQTNRKDSTAVIFKIAEL